MKGAKSWSKGLVITKKKKKRKQNIDMVLFIFDLKPNVC